MRARLISVPAVCLLAALAAACSRPAGTVTPASESTLTATSTAEASAPPLSQGTTPVSKPAAPAVKPPPSPAEDASAEDGRHFGYLRKVTAKGSQLAVTVDYAQFLTGKEAADAAAAHGDESPPPNDFYILNDNPKLRTFTLASGAAIAVVISDHKWNGADEPRTYTPKQFAAMWADPAYESLRQAPWWLTVEDGAVTRIDEQYIP